MKLWSRASLVTFAVALVALTGCARERSGDVHEGPAEPDAVEVVQHDDAFAARRFAPRGRDRGGRRGSERGKQ